MNTADRPLFAVHKASSGHGALKRRDQHSFVAEAVGAQRVPAIIYATRQLMTDMEADVVRQLRNVACLPGIVRAAFAMPDAHTGYGFPIGGVAAFDAEAGGVVCAGGVGYDISCGVRTLATSLAAEDVLPHAAKLADALFGRIPAGLGGKGGVHLAGKDMDAMLSGGADWAVKRGFGERADLERIEGGPRAPGADPGLVSAEAKARQADQTGTLGSGNHYLEVQQVTEILDQKAAAALGVFKGQVLASIHCGSRGLGHQVATDYIKRMAVKASRHGLQLPDAQLACAPITSQLGREYLAAMRAATNCALANRQVLTHLVRGCLAEMFPGSWARLIADVSHNTCREESHSVNGVRTTLFVHRKGATRALGPEHPELPPCFRQTGQPVPIGGSMGSASYLVVGGRQGGECFHSTCHGAGRSLSRQQALKRFRGAHVLEELAASGIHIRSHGLKGLGEEAPGAYKNVEEVIHATSAAGLSHPVVKMTPVLCVKG